MKRMSLIVVAILSGFGREHWAVSAAETAPPPPPSAPAQYSEAELEKLVMPIALHPDPLVSIILPAAVYPVEIVQAARFVKDTNNLPLVDQQPWDENVKAVAKFPDLIARMDADLGWTVGLGQAFLEQPKAVMDTIQALRAKAQKAGTLQTTPQQVVIVTNTVVEKTVEQQVVVVTNTIVEIQPSNPQVIYVPTYPPTVYYPPPTYVYDPYAPLVTFGMGLAVGAIIANNHCDWHGGGVYVGHHGVVAWGGGYHGDVNMNVNRNINVNRPGGTAPPAGNRPASPGARPTPQKWQPDQNRLRTSGASPPAQTREARGWGGATTQPSQRPAAGGGAARPSQLPSSGVSGARPATQPSSNWSQRSTAGPQPARSPGAGQTGSTAAQRPTSSMGGARATSSWQQSSAARPAQSSSFSRPSSQPSSAFSGVSSGSNARNYSNRGAASRGGGGFRGGGGGGGGRR